MSRTLFTNVMIFEGTGKDLTPGEVLVQGNRIHAVAGQGESLPREGCEVVDAAGATLMPGMVNTGADGHGKPRRLSQTTINSTPSTRPSRSSATRRTSSGESCGP